MKLQQRIILLATLIATSLASKSQSTETFPSNRIDSLLNEAIKLNIFSGNVLIAHDGTIAYEKSFGKANYETGMPNSPETKFQIASITKDFTKVMILELAEVHKISLNDSIGKFLSGFSDEVKKVTILQLLSFRSGLGDYHQSMEFQDLKENGLTVKDILPIVKKEKLHFTPGTQFLYSNSGYVVLAAIIEEVTGKGYDENLKELILDKCNMKNTGINGYANPMPGIATGYLSNEIGPLKNNSGWTLCGCGDGGIYTTTNDLLSFITAVIFTNKLINDSSKMIYVGEKSNTANTTKWDDFKMAGAYAPAGGAPGVSSLFTINMKTKNIVIILSNFDEGTAEDIGIRLGAILNNKTLQPLHEPASRYLYNLIKTKGGKYFEENYSYEIEKSGMMPDDDMVLFTVGRGLRDMNDIQGAISLYKVYTTLFPKIFICWNELGECYLQFKDKENAKKCFEEALKIQPGNPRVKDNLSKTQ